MSVSEERDHKLSESLLDQYTEVLANREANLKVSLGETGIAVGGVTVDMDQVDDAFVATRDACLQHRLDEVTLQDPFLLTADLVLIGN